VSRFSGTITTGPKVPGQKNKGILRNLKELRREEAEGRASRRAKRSDIDQANMLIDRPGHCEKEMARLVPDPRIRQKMRDHHITYAQAVDLVEGIDKAQKKRDDYKKQQNRRK